MNTIRSLLHYIYGNEAGSEAEEKVRSVIDRYSPTLSPPESTVEGMPPLDEGDAFVITYGDQFHSPGKRPLQCLGEFLETYLSDVVSGVHILPFFPYSSDDGFSIIDYRAVNGQMGTWDDVLRIGKRFRLMSDLVLNHCSKESLWFQEFLRGNGKYRDYFISVEKGTDLSSIVRPRSLPLLTEFETSRGTEQIWTTFSADQVDLNFANPDVLIEMIDVFLFHVSRGVQVIRLDAIAYVWKEIGHPSIHHAKTHAIVQLFRAICDEVVPWVVLLTETNVPHTENLSYFGNGRNEAHMIYQFSLPPLTLDAFVREDAEHLRSWASTVETTENPVTYFNFLASHDGIGVTPAYGILEEDELSALIDTVQKRGGLVSFKATAKGDVPYELNINYKDAVTDPDLSTADRVAQFMASQAVMLSVVGVPGIYIHSLLGSGNYSEGVAKTGMNRTINREKLDYEVLRSDLGDPDSFRAQVFARYRDLLRLRRASRAFHPRGAQRVLDVGPRVFCVVRTSPDESQKVVCLINLFRSRQSVSIDTAGAGIPSGGTCVDLVGGARIELARGVLAAELSPWQVAWFSV